MIPLLFPNPDSLRLALAAGVVPAEAARRAVGVRHGESGELWLAPAAPLPREVLAALARIGVRSHTAPPTLPTTTYPCWAAPLPLVPGRSDITGSALVELPVARLARFAVRARRRGATPLRFQFLASSALLHLSNDALADEPDVTHFRMAAPGVWVQHGYDHPLPAELAVPAGQLALVRPPNRWQLVPTDGWINATDQFAVRGRAEPVPPHIPTSFPIPLRVRATTTDGNESLWVLDGGSNRLLELLRDADERMLRRFRIARVRHGSTERIFLRPKEAKRLPVLPPPFRGFVPHPALGGVFLPRGVSLVPSPRADRLARLLDATPRHLLCVEFADGAPHVLRVPVAAFQPLDAIVAYTAPPPVRMTECRPDASPFALPPFTMIPEATVPPPSPPLPTPRSAPATNRWLGRVAGWLFGAERREQQATKKRSVRKKSIATPRADDPAVPNAEWDAHRSQAERAVLAGHAAAGPSERGEMWVNLAGVLRDSGKPADAAVCWVNAIWDHATPPPELWTEWVRAEARAAKLTPADASGVVARPDSPRFARIAAALIAEIGFAADPHPDADHWPELLRQVDTFEADLPVRAVWLARLAAANAAGGDALGLARCRDRLLARLAVGGPALDLDAPAFLRFHGAANGGRFRAAREWLLHVREPIRRWVQKQATGQRLGWAGLDPDPKPTAAYADLMLAWGLSRLGDRTRANEWADRAEHTLTRVRGHGVDPQVHAALLARFRDRIRAARHGHSERKSDTRLSPAPLADDLSHYAVEKLCAHSHILAATADPYRGQDLAAFLGTDPLGERLLRLVRSGEPNGVAKALEEVVFDPTARALPRVVLAASAGGPLTTDAATRLLPLVPRAVELMPEAVRLAFPPDADTRAILKRLTARALTAGCRIAVRHDLPTAFEVLVRCVIDHTSRGDEVIRTAAVRQAPLLFGTLRRIGLTAAAGELATTLTASGADLPASVWFVIGQDDAGVRKLDAARERLFVTGVPDERERTDAALDYVASLAQAPPRIALGRLEELFQRLDRISTAGATARYYALRPLELIDRAVTAVVSDEFNLGPAVRRWLDDDEFLIRKRIARDLTAALARP